MYYSIEEMLETIDHPVNRKRCIKLLSENDFLLKTAPGSSHNHQVWPGGYWDHIQEVMNIAIVLYDALDHLRILPFTLGEALLVLFLHDIEKPWKYAAAEYDRVPLASKQSRREFRISVLKRYNIELNPAQKNAMKYVEGEGDDYQNTARIMNELAAFCHMCDVWSAKGWYDSPRATNDLWPGAVRHKKPKAPA